MADYYNRDGQPIDLMTWCASFERPEDKRVDKTTVGDAEVSTVWLGIDHSFGAGRPLIFETMIFGGEQDQWQDRYSTEGEARVGHAAAVAWLRGEADEPSYNEGSTDANPSP